ncbi:MAG: type II toxin-antitoxin system RelE/ParE family toxin [Nitrospinae bacterium]|nr:type II toxin-antitoxin system RelE/ParE family toxin [Nitrospinota bacterium]
MGQQFEVLIYVTENGKVPFQTWLNGLKDRKGRYLIKTRIDRIEDGNFGDCKSVGQGIFELRIKYGSGYRVYFGKDGDHIVLLLCGGTKSSQQKDITTARKYWLNYKERKNG